MTSNLAVTRPPVAKLVVTVDCNNSLETFYVTLHLDKLKELVVLDESIFCKSTCLLLLLEKR